MRQTGSQKRWKCRYNNREQILVRLLVIHVMINISPLFLVFFGRLVGDVRKIIQENDGFALDNAFVVLIVDIG